MSKKMTSNESFRAGFIIDAVDQETGEVVSYEFKQGIKFTRKNVMIILETVFGWSMGSILLLEEHGDSVTIMDENHSVLGYIGKKLADSLSIVRFVKYIN